MTSCANAKTPAVESAVSAEWEISAGDSRRYNRSRLHNLMPGVLQSTVVFIASYFALESAVSAEEKISAGDFESVREQASRRCRRSRVRCLMTGILQSSL